jgi:phosphonate transport system substrate-binding protein
MMNRRQWLAACGVMVMTGATMAAQPRPFRIGMTPAFLHDQYSLLEDWRRYLEARLGRPVEFVQRDSYRETMDLLRQERLDFAWICDYPYVHLRNHVRLLAVPLNQHEPIYRAYFIVPAGDSQTSSLAQLKGKVFAYADPYSNTGYLVPRYHLKQSGEDPERFFSKTFFTWSHRKVIEAVASGVAQGGAVDSFVFDTLAKLKPAIVSRTRIIGQSADFGFPPFVARASEDPEMFRAMQKVLMDMEHDPDGKVLLRRLNLDGFVPGNPRYYERVAEMMKAFGEY